MQAHCSGTAVNTVFEFGAVKRTTKQLALVMGGGASRREPEVHVVVVQSQENGKMDAKLLRQTFVRTGEVEKGQESIKGDIL